MLQTIDLNGKERPVSFAPITLIEFEKSAGINLLKGDTVNGLNFALLGKLAYFALKYGARFNKDKFDYTEEQVLMWFPTLESLTKIIELFTDAMPAENQDSEKKLTQVKELKPNL